jgi:hypothetical protein
MLPNIFGHDLSAAFPRFLHHYAQLGAGEFKEIAVVDIAVF